MDLRWKISGQVTVSDASETGGAFFGSQGLTPEGLVWSNQCRAPVTHASEEEVLLIGIFDGIGGLRRSWKLLRLECAGFWASEIDTAAIR
eukprot:3507174-Heterocapsa_arctica.AAC.1